MSIDARVRTVLLNEDGSGSLELEDRPPRWKGDNPGIAGQARLSFESAPEVVTALNWRDIWGNDSVLMLGDRRIAARLSYTKIRFVDGEAFKDAVAEESRRLRGLAAGQSGDVG